MTPNELATFLREEVPSLKVTSKLPLTHRLLGALDAAVGLLREAKDFIECPDQIIEVDEEGVVHDKRKDILATLRLVVGEKETG